MTGRRYAYVINALFTLKRCMMSADAFLPSTVKYMKTNSLADVILFSTPEAAERQEELDWLIKDVLSSSTTATTTTFLLGC